jgi:hypothetical protein
MHESAGRERHSSISSPGGTQLRDHRDSRRVQADHRGTEGQQTRPASTLLSATAESTSAKLAAEMPGVAQSAPFPASASSLGVTECGLKYVDVDELGFEFAIRRDLPPRPGAIRSVPRWAARPVALKRCFSLHQCPNAGQRGGAAGSLPTLWRRCRPFQPLPARTSPDRQLRTAGAQLRIPDCSVAFTQRSQHLYRERLEPAFPIGTLFARRGLGIQPRPVLLLSPTADSSLDFFLL